MPRNQWRSEKATGHLPPFGHSAIRQALDLKCTHQVEQGKILIYHYKVNKIFIF